MATRSIITFADFTKINNFPQQSAENMFKLFSRKAKLLVLELTQKIMTMSQNSDNFKDNENESETIDKILKNAR